MNDITEYRGNVNLKRKGTVIEWTQEMVREFVKCSQEPLYFVQNYIKIVHVDHGLIPINLYDYQREIIEKVANNRRTCVVTARQAGKTTTAVAIILHYVLFNEHKTVALLANKGDSAREILDRIKLAYESLPKWLQQGVVEWNKGSVEFENGCKILAGSTSSSSIRGKSCVTGDTKVCIEDGDDYYLVEIKKLINIDKS
jgi:phage terminase large subunit-like protein